MKVIVVGLGIQGAKRLRIAANDVVATVDPYKADADFKDIKQVDLNSYQAALVCTPDDTKIELLTYLLSNRKHVLVEKPIICESDREIEALMQLAKKNGVSCYTAYNHRFEPFIAKARGIIESKEIGDILSLRMFYGNGTAREVRDSVWRDKGMGVLSDLGSHLLDTTNFLLGSKRTDLRSFSSYKLENKAADFVLFGSTEQIPRIQLEATLLSWRNSFYLDLIGSLGSLHINCLCKWGPSTLTVRKRVLPSGRPSETNEVLEIKDPTWQLEYDYFTAGAEKGITNLETDLWINQSLRALYKNS